jgi:carboxyl-terminal processing protease
MKFSRPLLKPSLVAWALLATTLACTSPASNPGGNRIVTPPPEARQPVPNGTPGPGATPGANATPAAGTALVASPTGALNSDELHAGYQALIDNYVDPVDGDQLIKAGSDALRQQMSDQVVLPMVSLPLEMLPDPTGNADRDWQTFGDAYDAVVKKDPTWAAQAHPDWAVLKSMAESLKDGHTTFLTPQDVQRRNETSFAGIGVLLSKPEDNGAPLIGEVFPNSPAQTGGLQRGDRILAIRGPDGNWQDLAGMSIADVATLIRGQTGSAVGLRVQRVSAPAPKDITIQRAQVNVDQVYASQVRGVPIGYLRIRGFGDDQVADNTLGILQAGQQRGIKAWIVDLRGNSGGALNAVVTTAGGFLDQNHPVVGYEVDRQRHQQALTTEPVNLVSGDQVVVLVDKDTASGAEILTAALKEAGVARIVGQTTAGNVGVAKQVPLADGSMMQVTENRFVSPSGAQLDGVGVAPDQPVDMTDGDIENDRDPQLQQALQTVAQGLGLTAASGPATPAASATAAARPTAAGPTPAPGQSPATSPAPAATPTAGAVAQ